MKTAIRCKHILNNVVLIMYKPSLAYFAIQFFFIKFFSHFVLVINNYSKNQEFFLKQQERINQVTNGRYYKSAYMRKLPKMSQAKAYKQYLENTENKAELIDRF